MQNNLPAVKSAPQDAIGPINYPQQFEKAALPVGAAFTIVITVTMITGSVSKAISLSIVAALLVCALYALFRLWPAIIAWFASHPRISTTTHFALIFFGALGGFALMLGGK